ncbi:hypothetical protein Btru_011993 [Bulinus truncatus]|nr:hypothetical protein Btru_011993 [Bulinus truncatus]
MDATDNRFVAAWWLAFLIFGAGTVLSSFPLLLFPKRLISKKKQKQALDKAYVTFAGGNLGEEGNVTVQSKSVNREILSSTPGHPDLAIRSNKKFSLEVARDKHLASVDSSLSKVSSVLYSATDGPTDRKVSVTGEVVFKQSVGGADVESGQTNESTTLDLIKDFPKALYRLFRMPIFILILVDIAIISVPMNGISMFRNTYMANEYNIRMSEVSYSSVNTSSLCDCTHSQQLISCGSDGNNYLSPCFAGCSGVQGKSFVDCALLQNFSGGVSELTPGLCPTDCHTNFLIYVVLHGVQYLVEGATQIPRFLLILRIVDIRDRAFAISFFMFFNNIISIPSSNIFGSIIDKTCLTWDGDFCSLYDRDKISRYVNYSDIITFTYSFRSVYLVLQQTDPI